jgi:hypothetical protein
MVCWASVSAVSVARVRGRTTKSTYWQSSLEKKLFLWKGYGAVLGPQKRPVRFRQRRMLLCDWSLAVSVAHHCTQPMLWREKQRQKQLHKLFFTRKICTTR